MEQKGQIPFEPSRKSRKIGVISTIIENIFRKISGYNIYL